ncbi:MAG: alpha-amylase family glycosyl hydrolase, partial [Opitutales bacterium]
MSSETHRITKAFFASLTEGIVELSSDWRALRPPHLSIEGELVGHLDLERLLPSDFAWESRYFVDGQGRAVFVFDPNLYPYVDYDKVGVYVAGPFNGWQEALGQEAWQLKLEEIDGKAAYVARCPVAALGAGEVSFKFVTEGHVWLPVDSEAPNVAHDGDGNRNYVFSDKRSGRHRFRFALQRPVDLSEVHYLIYHGRVHSQRAYLEPGPFFYELKSEKPLGAIVGDSETVFRLFAPRAKWVKVGFFMPGETEEAIHWVLMERSEDFVWETSVPRNLAGAYYWFRLDGPDGACSLFDPKFKILDPYAKATVSREGPGIVVDDGEYAAMPAFHPAAWQDLVTMEVHTRDLVAGLPEFSDESRPLGFADLERYVKSDAFYPKSLGANALELQPVQENDSQSYGEYHWGYMTANFFSPASSYASDPQSGSQVEEFRSLVNRLHEQGMAVILDVVYNHVGEPAHLMFIDKLYYFHLEQDGTPVNWSGCGNDLRC